MEKYNQVIIILILSLFLASCGEDERPVRRESIMPAAREKTEERAPVADEAPEERPELAGQIFNTPVPVGNYYFVLRTVITYNTPWGSIPSDRQELEKRIWEELLLSFEAFRRGIEVSGGEVKEEIEKTLKSYDVEFDWHTDEEAYEAWLREKMNASPELFENQMRHLVQLKKLQQEILNNAEPEVSREEAFQEFLNEHNTLSVELVQFDELAEAEKFYRKMKADPKLWDQQKEENPDKFRKPGFVALEFLMHMWKLPKKAVYDMIEMEAGSLYPPTPIYKGYGVFKVLKIRRADESEFAERKKSYYEQIELRKRYKAFNKWLRELKKEADIQKYIEPPEGIFSEQEREKEGTPSTSKHRKGVSDDGE